MYTIPTPRTWTTGEYPDGAIFNSDVRDNFAFLATPPSVRCYRAGNFTVTDSTDTAVTFDTNRYDTLPSGVTGPQHSTSSNTARLTCKAAGKYHAFGGVEFDGDAGGVNRSVAVRLNGTTFLAQDTRPPNGANLIRVPIATVWKLTVGDYLELVVYQDSGGNLDILRDGNISAEFGWQWLGF